jgi:hypothetical protein
MESFTEVFVPINAGNLDLLLLDSGLNADRVKVFLNILMFSMVQQMAISKRKGAIDRNGFVPIHSTLLKKILTDHYSKAIAYLTEQEMIIVRQPGLSKKSYIANVISQQYKISPKMLQHPISIKCHKTAVIIDHKANKAYQNYLQKFHNKNVGAVEVDSVYEKLYDVLLYTGFKTEEAERFCKQVLGHEIIIPGESLEDGNTRPYKEYLLMMDSLNNGIMLWFTVDSFGERVHTVVTNLWRYFRSFIYFKNEPEADLTSIDLCNSQPFFASISVNSGIIKQIVPEFIPIISILEPLKDKPDFKLFASLCATGTLYEHWMLVRNITDREVAKKEFLQLMYSRVKSYDEQSIRLKDAFHSEFPSVKRAFDTVKSLTDQDLPFLKDIFLNKSGKYSKGNSHKVLSCLAQRVESRIFIKKIAQNLLDKGIQVITIHDSIILKQRDSQQSINVINQVFSDLNIERPKLKIQSL